MREHLISVVVSSCTTHRVLTHLIIYTNEINYKLYVYKPNEYINHYSNLCITRRTLLWVHARKILHTRYTRGYEEYVRWFRINAFNVNGRVRALSEHAYEKHFLKWMRLGTGSAECFRILYEVAERKHCLETKWKFSSVSPKRKKCGKPKNLFRTTISLFSASQASSGHSTICIERARSNQFDF